MSSSSRVLRSCLVPLLLATACKRDERNPATREGRPRRAPLADEKLGRAAGNPVTMTSVRLDPGLLRACGFSRANARVAFDPAAVSSRSTGQLQALAACLDQDWMKEVSLVVTAPATGDDEGLAQSREGAVTAFLVARGVDAGRITVEPRPVTGPAGRLDEDLWPVTRRVDVRIADPSKVDRPTATATRTVPAKGRGRSAERRPLPPGAPSLAPRPR